MLLNKLMVLTLMFIGASAFPECPAGMVTCVCRDESMITCRASSAEVLARDLEIIGKAKTAVSWLTIYNFQLQSIPARFFGDALVTNADLYVPNVKNASDDAFVGQEECLERIEIDEADFSSIPNSALGKVAKLRTLKISYSTSLRESLNEHDFANFSSPKNLRFLDLTHNNLTSVGARTFAEFTFISLDLSYNKLASLGANIFRPGPVDILFLTLKFNKFTEFPIGVASAMIQDTVFDLKNNFITHLSEGDIKFIIDRKSPNLELGGNKLVCSCDFKSMTKLQDPDHFCYRVSGECAQPSERNGTSLCELKASQFASCSA